jgi:pilus assembly protein CpaC
MNGFITSLLHRHILIAGAVLALSGLMVGDAQAARAAAAPNFYVPLNRSELISVSTDIAEVLIADPEVADVVVHGKRKVSVLGKAVGQTTLRIFDTNHKLIRGVDVYVTYDLPAVRRSLKEFLPNERIGVSMVNTRMALTGEVSSAAAAASAMEIAEEFIRGKLSAEDASRRAVTGSGNSLSPIINLMKVGAGQQVMLRIKVGEVNRTAVRNLGVNMQHMGTDGLLGLGAFVATGSGSAGVLEVAGSAVSSTAGGYKGGAYSYTKPESSFASFGFDKSSDKRSLSGQLDALERDGLLKVLAEPSLTALSGEEAQFLAGGELPIPVAQSLGGGSASGNVTVEYKPYGVGLKFTPYVLNKNRIRITVAPEVSELSNEGAIESSGFNIPSFITRRAATTIELAPGESFMIAGLLRDDMTTTINQLPGASQIPVLGALFRSTAYQRKETELVIAVTPYLVDPLKDSDVKLPTDDFRPPTFVESVFFGALASNKGAKASSLEGPAGFMTDN